MKRRIYAIAIACILAVAAHGKEYKPQRIRLPEDISNNVTSIVKDASGFIWLGTASGLARYDGYGFLSFHKRMGDPHSLASNYVTGIVADPRGYLWVQTDAGYSIFDIAQETFCNDVEAELAKYGIDGRPAHVASTGDGMLWIATSAAFYALDTAKGQATPVSMAGRSLEAAHITHITYGSRYVAAVTSNEELWLIDRPTKAVSKVVKVPGISLHQHPAADLSVYSDRDDMLWIWTIGDLILYDVHSGRFVDSGNIRKMIPGVLECFRHDRRGHVWVARNHQGITLLDKSRATLGTALSDDVVREIENQTIGCLYEDNNGTIWIGSNKYGLYRCDETSTRFDLLPVNDVNVVAPGTHNDVWIGTDANWLFHWNPEEKQATQVPLPDPVCRDKAITCLLENRRGGVYVGTYEAGVIDTEPNGRGRRYTVDDGLHTNSVWALCYDADGTLWAGTLGYGVQYLDKLTGRWVGVAPDNPNDDFNYVMSLALAGDGKIYAGTANGLRVIDTEAKTNEPLTIPGLSNTYISQAIMDSEGVLWIASRGGLNYYSPLTGKAGCIDLGLEIETPFVHGIAEDPEGTIWLTLSSMIASVRIDDLDAGKYTVTIYDEEDGLPGSDYSHRSITLLGTGEAGREPGRSYTIAAGGLHGVTYFRPMEFACIPGEAGASQGLGRRGDAPRVMFSALYLNGQRVKPRQQADGMVVIDRSLSSAPTIHIPSPDNHFTIHFATDNATTPQKTRYYYRMGDGKDWIQCIPGTHFVACNGLPPGKHTLYVKSVTAEGRECPQPSVIDIVVHPPLWATPWAVAVYTVLAAVAVAAAIALLRRRKARQLRRREREAEIERHEQLNQMKLRFFTNISHELRTPLTLIISPLESMLNDGTLTAAMTRKVDMIYRNAHHLLNLVNQILDMRKIEMHGLQLQPRHADVLSFVRALASDFDMQAANNSIDYRVATVPDSYNMCFDHDKLGKIINNLLSNAFKFTPEGGSVWLEAEAGDAALTIKVSDTGIGIPDTNKKHVFERFYQTGQGNNTGSGIGLNMVWEYVQLFKGTVGVDDNPCGRGTVFTVTIPSPDAGGAHDMPDAAKLPDDGKARPGDRPTALVVDDNHDIIALLGETLGHDYNVVSATNGKAALEAMAGCRPDIIVTDVMMPVMDGIELCRKVKSDATTAPIPLIMLTARHDISDTLLGLTIGADDYMTKPYNPEELLLRMGKLIKLTRGGMKRSLIQPQPSDIKIISLDEKLIGKAVEYVEQNMGKPDLSVEQLSDHLGMSRVHLYKKMMQLTGKPPKEFIRTMRLKRAAQMLRESQLTVAEIAYTVGFGLPRLFSKYFKEEYGILPSEYKDTYGK